MPFDFSPIGDFLKRLHGTILSNGHGDGGQSHYEGYRIGVGFEYRQLHEAKNRKMFKSRPAFVKRLLFNTWTKTETSAIGNLRDAQLVKLFQPERNIARKVAFAVETAKSGRFTKDYIRGPLTLFCPAS